MGEGGAWRRGVDGGDGEDAVEGGGKALDGGVPVALQADIGDAECFEPVVALLPVWTHMQRHEAFVVEALGEVACPGEYDGGALGRLDAGYDELVFFHRMSVMSPLKSFSTPLWQRMWQV